MQTLHQELELSPQAQQLDAHPSLRGLMADQATAYAVEVRALRQRVATLESALAAATVTHTVPAAATRDLPPLTSIDFAPRGDRGSVLHSEFVEQTTPAVVAIGSSPQAQTQPQTRPQTTVSEPLAPATAETAPVPTPTAEAVEPVPNPGFAQAWSADDSSASFEERVAERAFFQASTVDEESRTWLLAH